LLADDHGLVVDGLRKLLEVDFEIVGAVGDGRSAVSAFEQLRPDLLLLDVGLPLLNGIEAARQVRKSTPGARILFVTMRTDRIYVQEAMRAGAAGYVLKQAAAQELVEAIRAVLSGRKYISPMIRHEPAGDAANGEKSVRGRLTPRQREVLQLIAEGKAMKQIADILGISVRTVEFHKNGIMEELGVRSTAELTRYALDQGIFADRGAKVGDHRG
jgi:DNA-binding NarL/FixJ family response regulator